jgi:TATA-binding protein-associated factor Taf7
MLFADEDEDDDEDDEDDDEEEESSDSDPYNRCLLDIYFNMLRYFLK